MPFNGSGTFVSLPPPDFPAVPGTVILASAFNANMNDLFTNGLTKCLTRDGQSPPTANLPMAGFRFTGIGAGVADTDSAQLGQTLATRGQVGTVDWDTRITNGVFEATAASLTGPSANFPPTNEVGQLVVMAQGANVIQQYNSPYRTFLRRKVGGVWTLWAPGQDQAVTATIASSATTLIGDSDSFDVIISGTANISSFGTVQAGINKRLRFLASLTIVHNGTSLVLENGVNFVTAANDVLTFVSLGGGNWREVARWREISTVGALDTLASTGIIVRTAPGTLNTRAITGTANKITVTNGDGLAGQPTLTIPDAVTLVTPTVTGLLNSTGGQIQFPATQVSSANPNTLDDYEEGTFTPALTFTGPGDQSIVYSTQVGHYTKIGRRVFIDVFLVTTTFAHTTSAGNLQFNLPITAANFAEGVMECSGFTFPAGYSAVVAQASAGVCQFHFYSGTAANPLLVLGVTHHVTGNNIVLTLTMSYNAAT